ncbi:serine kinase [candidate division KSB1 bacterium]|nr:serine kinase [candidate division KSB1 bacterium]
MKLEAIVEKMNMKVVSGSSQLDREVTGGYASDLMSDVIANSKEGDLWVTLQIHQNIVAVAQLKELSGIIIVNNRNIEVETLKKAKEVGLPIMVTELPAFEIIGKLYELGVDR